MDKTTELILNLKTVMDISDVKHNADQIQQFFGKLKLSDSMTKDTKKIFENLEKAIASYQAKLQTKPKKGVNSGLQKEGQNIIKLFNQLETKISKISLVDLKRSFKFDDQEIVKLNQRLEETKEKLKKATSIINSEFQTSGIIQGLESVKKGFGGVDEEVQGIVKKSTALRNVFSRIGTGDLEGALKSLQSFEDKINALPQNIKGVDQVKNYINQIRISIQQAAQSGDIQNLKTEISEIQTIINDGEANFFKELLEVVRKADPAVEELCRQFGILHDNTEKTYWSQAQLNNEIDSMKNRITTFFGLQNAASLARRAIQNVFNTVKELDAAMAETAVVTDFSIGDMWEKLPQYTERANEYGLAIRDIYEADTLFYQQGLKTKGVVELSNETMKMARIAGLDTTEATDRMTNALRGFNMELNKTNAQNVADVYSQLAAITASDVNELSVAMTKTASIAANAGASFENTAAFIAQIVETTRESAETAGTALKTVIARFTELKKDPSEIGEVDGEVVDANKIETALRTAGVALRDANGSFRDFDDVILELSSKWDSLNKNTQRYIATVAAGSRQQSRFIALMSNNARLTQLVTEANAANGASQKQYEKTLESLETKINKLKNATNEFLLGIADSSIIKGAIDLLTGLLNTINKVTNGWDSMSKSFLKIGFAFATFKLGGHFVSQLFQNILPQFEIQGMLAGENFNIGVEKKVKSNNFWNIFNKGIDSNTQLPNGDSPKANIKDILSGYGKILIIIAAIYAAIKIVEGGVSAWNSSIDTAQEKMESFKNAADAVNESLTKTYDRLNSFESTKTTLQDLANELSNCAHGTAEWSQKALQLREEYDKIIEGYPELIEYTTEVNGVITLTNEGFEQYQTLLNNDARSLQATHLGLKSSQEAMRVQSLRQTSLNTNAIDAAETKVIETATGWGAGIGGVGGGIAGGVAGGVVLGGQLGAWGGPIGAAIGIIAGAIIGAISAGVNSAIVANAFDVSDEQAKKVTDKAIKEGFTAKGKSNEEIQEFLSDLELTSYEVQTFTEYLKDSAEQFDSIVEAGIKLEQQQYEYAKQIGFILASNQDDVGEGGEAERWAKLYADKDKEARQNDNKRLEEIKEEMKKQYDSWNNDWYDTGEFQFDKKYAKEGLYTKYAEIMGYTFDAANIKNPFIDKASGERVDMSQITDANIIDVVALKMLEEELAKETNKEFVNSEKEIRKDIGNIYNQLAARLGVVQKEWIYDLTEQQIAGLNAQLNQVNIQGGSIDAYSKALQSIINSAIGQGLALTDVMSIVSAASVDTKSNFWSLKDSLENFAIGAGKLGFEIEDTLIEAAIAAADAIGNINLNKLAEGAETIKEVVDSFGRATNRIVSAEELEFLKSFRHDNDWYEFRDDGTAVITDPNWQYGLLKGVEEKSIGDIEEKYSSINSAYLQQQELERSQSISLDKYQKYKLPSSDLVSMKGISNIINSLDKESIEESGRLGDFTQLENLATIIESIDTEDWLEDEDNLLFIETILEGTNTDTDVSSLINDSDIEGLRKIAIDAFEYKINSLIDGGFGEDTLLGATGYRPQNYNSIDDVINNVESISTESLSKFVKEQFGVDIEDREVLVDYLTKWRDNSKIDLQVLRNDGEFQTLLEGSWLGQEALNYSQKRNNEAEKIYSEKALESLDTMAYSIEGITSQIYSYHSQVNASLAAIKAFSVENYKAALSIDGLVSDLNEYSDALNIPGTQEYNKAISEISQSIVNMGWAKSEKEAVKFFKANSDNFLKIMEGGENAQHAYELVADTAAKELKKSLGVSEDISKAFDAVLSTGLKPGKAIDLTENIKGFEDIFTKGREELEKLATLLEAAGFTVTVDFEQEDFLITRNSIEGTGVNNEGIEAKWFHSYDKYHNLLQDINAELRERNNLERELNNLTSDKSLIGDTKELKQNVQAQIDSLDNSIVMNKVLAAGRAAQLGKYNTIGDEKGWSEYAKWDSGSNTVRIDWDALNAVKGSWSQETGQDFEEWVSQMQEWSDEIAEAKETVAEDTKQRDELLKFGREEYMQLEQKIYDAIIQREQELIDGMRDAAGSISEANQELLNGLQKSINKMRQQRQNKETEKEISDQEQQLAYLSQSTTANPLEIMRLEDSIAEQRENYTDQLIDQKISELQEQNEQAENQREKQISIAQAQLDYNKEMGVYWQQTKEIIESGIEPGGGIKPGSQMESLLKASANWNQMSEEQRKTFLGESTDLVSAAKVYMSEELESRPPNKKEYEAGVDRLINKFSNSGDTTLKSDDIKKAISDALAEILALQGTNLNTLEMEQAWKEAGFGSQQEALAMVYAASLRKEKVYANGYQWTLENYEKIYGKATEEQWKEAIASVGSTNIIDGGSAHILGEAEALVKLLMKQYAIQASAYAAVIAANAMDANAPERVGQNPEKYRISQFATGGLADFTGPAWLDGTKSAPEIVLNAQDTRNFLQLRDVLSDLFKGGNFERSGSSGDNYYDIDINVDEISNDYDVDQLAERIKQQITNDAMYRNVNALNFMR